MDPTTYQLFASIKNTGKIYTDQTEPFSSNIKQGEQVYFAHVWLWSECNSTPAH